MSIDDETLLELVAEEDLNNFELFEEVAQKVFSSGSSETIRSFLRKMHFSFLSSDDGYRTRVLERLVTLTEKKLGFSLQGLAKICSDTLVGNYLILLASMQANPVLNLEIARDIINIVPRLEYLTDVCLFGFPYQGNVMLQIDERVKTFTEEEKRLLEMSCEMLFRMGYFSKSKVTVESYQHIYDAIGKQEYVLRTQLISSLLKGDGKQFSFAISAFGFPEFSEEKIVSMYFEIWHFLEKLSLPIFFNIDNLRYNGVLFNDNFYFLKYMNFEGKEKIIYPFSQAPLSDVNKIYDPQADMFYTPRERYGRLAIGDVYSFREIKKVDVSTHEATTAILAMDEDTIQKGIRNILKDANLTSHSPIELADVLTQNLYVNSTDDLRLSGFILKGQSFGRVHLNDVAGQILKVCQSPIKIVFLVHVPPIDDSVTRIFIEECESKQKNYCIVDRNDLARLFIAYEILQT